MKKKKIIWTEEVVDVGVDEVVEDLFDNYYDDFITNQEFDPSLVMEHLEEDDDYELTDAEKQKIVDACAKKFESTYKEDRNEELKLLKDRKSILNIIEDWLDHYNFKDVGDLGYILTSEEILDEIIKNGNK